MCSVSKAPHILDLGIRWGWVITSNSQLLYLQEKSPQTACSLGQQPAWTWQQHRNKFLLWYESKSGCPARSPLTDTDNAACKSKESYTILHVCRFVNGLTSHLHSSWLQATSMHVLTHYYYCSTTCSFPSSYPYTTCWWIWFVQNSLINLEGMES